LPKRNVVPGNLEFECRPPPPPPARFILTNGQFGCWPSKGNVVEAGWSLQRDQREEGDFFMPKEGFKEMIQTGKSLTEKPVSFGLNK
jgi:hypothetical protein